MAKDRLQVLVGLREREEKEARKRLAAMQAEVRDVLAMIAELSGKQSASSKLRDASMWAIACDADHRIRGAIERAQEVLSECKRKETIARDLHLEAYRALESARRLRDNRAAAAEREARAKERRTEDEIAIMRHARGPRVA